MSLFDILVLRFIQMAKMPKNITAMFTGDALSLHQIQGEETDMVTVTSIIPDRIVKNDHI